MWLCEGAGRNALERAELSLSHAQRHKTYLAPDERILNLVRNSCVGFGQGLIGKNPRWSIWVKASGQAKHETYGIDIELVSSRLQVRSSSVDGSAFLALSKAFASLTRDVIQTLG